VVGLVHLEIANRHFQRHILVQCDELLRQPRLVGILDQRLAAFLLLDLGGAGKQRLQVAVFLDELRRRLDADAGHARYIVG